jgi:hypothetical protein
MFMGSVALDSGKVCVLGGEARYAGDYFVEDGVYCRQFD